MTSRSNAINSILTNGVVYNDKTYTYTTADAATYLPSFGIGYHEKGNGTVVIDGSGETLYPGGPILVTEGHTVSAATNGVAVDGVVASVTVGDVIVPTQIITLVSGPTITTSEVSPSVWAVHSVTLTVGGSAAEVYGDEVTAASTGVAIVETASPSTSTTSSTSGASKLTIACWASLVACGLLFSLL